MKTASLLGLILLLSSCGKAYVVEIKESDVVSWFNAHSKNNMIVLDSEPFTGKIDIRGTESYIGFHEGKIISWQPENLNKSFPELKSWFVGNLGAASNYFKSKATNGH